MHRYDVYTLEFACRVKRVLIAEQLETPSHALEITKSIIVRFIKSFCTGFRYIHLAERFIFTAYPNRVLLLLLLLGR